MATTTNFGWETPDDTDLVKDGALAIRTLGSAIDTSLVDLKGGTTGQVLSKTSNTDMDFTWVTSDDANAIQNTIVDAKGDLISASAADVPARLAVGNNGETLVADSSTSTGLRYVTPPASLSNPLINGNMEIAQRGTAAVTLSAAVFGYPVDRWFVARGSGTSGATAQQISSISLTGFNNAVRIQRTAGNTSTADLQFGQSFETRTSLPFAGKTVTVSFWARAGANYSSSGSGLGIRLYSGTGTDQSGYGYNFTGYAEPISTTQVITSSWVRYAVTGTVASSATQLQLMFFYTPVGTAGAADSVDITGVQIDVGTYASGSLPPFRLSANTLAGELAACQRYYYLHASGDQISIGLGTYTLSNELHTHVQFPVAMRVAPTIDQATGTNFYRCYRNGASDDFDSFIVSRANTVNTLLYQTGATISGTAGDAGIIHTQNVSARLAFTSEL